MGPVLAQSWLWCGVAAGLCCVREDEPAAVDRTQLFLLKPGVRIIGFDFMSRRFSVLVSNMPEERRATSGGHGGGHHGVRQESLFVPRGEESQALLRPAWAID